MKQYILLAFYSLILYSCTSSRNGERSPGHFDKEGHRGCRALMPENTIPAMLKAIDLGVNTLEMDIVFTADGDAILSHEPFFNHAITTKPDGSFIDEKDEKGYNIYKMNYAEMIRYDVGLKPHPLFPEQQKMAVHKPLLSELIDSTELHSRRHIHYNIETKTKPETDNLYHPAPGIFVDKLMAIVLEKGIAKRTTIESFDYRTLQYLHIHYPSIKTALLVEADDKNSFRKQIKDLGFTPTVYSPEFSLVTPSLVKECHEQKIKVLPWTVDDKNKLAELKAMGVDGAITDDPRIYQ